MRPSMMSTTSSSAPWKATGTMPAATGIHRGVGVMTLTNELRTMGVVQKVIDSEVDPSKPTYWSRHAWSFEGDGIVRLRLGKPGQ